jgi:hypothetical protein
MPEIITPSESVRLIELERVIEKGKTTFVEVGNALAEIRDSRIYRSSHGTFEDYCKERWDFRRDYVNKLIAASAVVSNLDTVVSKPDSERQARPLAKLPAEQQPAAWEKAQEIAKDEGKPVAARHVEAAVADLKDEEISPPGTYRPAQALSFATMAIAQLERIDKRDEQRKEAFQKVIEFCTKKLNNK